MPDDAKTTDVLVIGAGPTGLTLALALARYGIGVRIIEKKPQLSRYTKATNLMQRTQELIAALGLIEPMQAIGGQMSRLMVHAYGKCFGPRTMHLKESPFHDVILCGQHNYERVAAEALAAHGVQVEFETELMGLTQSGDEVVASLKCGEREERASFAYAVGCDGAAGVSRTFTRHDFTPPKTGVGIRQIDAKLSWRRSSTMDQMWLFYFDHGFAVVVPLPGDIHRLLTIEPKAAFPEREPSLEEMQAQMRVVTGDDSLTLSDPEWFSYSDLSMGLAPGMRDGRVFLAGDVANPVLPNGGQGMNTGIADAYDLGWKLAAVLRHGAPDALLDTFEEERRSLRKSIQDAQFNSLKYTTLSTPKAMQAAFRLLAEPLLGLGGEYAMAQAFSQLKQNTRKSSATLDLARGKGVRGGERALDASVARGHETVRLYDLIYRGGWTLLGFSGRGSAANGDAVARAIAALGRDDLNVYCVTKDARQEGSDLLYDLDEEAHRAWGYERPMLCLVRPDGHVAVRVQPHQVDRLRQYLAQWVPNATQRFIDLREAHEATSARFRP